MIIPNTLQYSEILELALELSKTYENVARIWVGPKLVVFLTNPLDVELILNSSVHIEKSDEYRFFKPWLGNGLLISGGDHWRAHRKLIAPAFHQNVLRSFVGTFNSNSHNVVRRMRKEVGKVFDVHDYMSETTVDILLGEWSEECARRMICICAMWGDRAVCGKVNPAIRLMNSY